MRLLPQLRDALQKSQQSQQLMHQGGFYARDWIATRDKRQHRTLGKSMADRNGLYQSLYVATRLLLTLKDALPLLGVVAIASLLWQLDEPTITRMGEAPLH